MNMNSKNYARYVEARAPRSPIGKNCLWAFLVGGGICLFAEGVIQLLFHAFAIPREDGSLYSSIILVLIAVVLTAMGLFSRIAKFAGGGTLLPITGFANAVASPAIDTKSEGMILGVGAKIFTVAGPVLLYGTVAGAIYGVVYYVATLLW